MQAMSIAKTAPQRTALGQQSGAAQSLFGKNGVGNCSGQMQTADGMDARWISGSVIGSQRVRLRKDAGALAGGHSAGWRVEMISGERLWRDGRRAWAQGEW